MEECISNISPCMPMRPPVRAGGPHTVCAPQVCGHRCVWPCPDGQLVVHTPSTSPYIPAIMSATWNTRMGRQVWGASLMAMTACWLQLWRPIGHCRVAVFGSASNPRLTCPHRVRPRSTVRAPCVHDTQTTPHGHMYHIHVRCRVAARQVDDLYMSRKLNCCGNSERPICSSV